MDRLLLNPWVSRAGNASFLFGCVLLIARLVGGWNDLLLLAVVLLGIGVILIAAPKFRRWRIERRRFADVVLSMGGQGVSAEPHGRVISLINVNVFNAEDHPVSLSFRMYERFKPPHEHGPLDVPLELTSPPESGNKISAELGLPKAEFHPLPRPLNIPPRSSVSGDYHFLRPMHFDQWGESEGFLVRVLDHYSDKVEEIAMMGEFRPGRRKK